MSRTSRLPALLLCLIIPVAAQAAPADGTGTGSGAGAAPAGPAAAPEMPSRGMTMQAVELGFGAPAKVIDAVGEPPITRWVYEGYTVYFDRHHVIHSVRTDAPATARGVGAAGRSSPHMAAR